jgi:PAS domain S-box-containing protein
MNNIDKSKEELLQELLELKKENESLKSLYQNDITERKLYEEALKESELRFRSIFENSNIGFYRTALDGKILFVNQAALEITGYKSFEDMIHHHEANRGYINKEDAEIFVNTIKEFGVIKGFESPWRKSDNLPIYIRESSWLIKDESGNPLYYEGSFEDISDRKLSEEALRLSEEKYRKLSEDMPIYISTVLPDGTITYVNKSLALTTGMNAYHLIGLNFFDFISPSDKKLVIEKLQSLTFENPSETHEQQYFTSEGNLVYQQWTNRAFFDNSGNLLYYQAVGIDITERKNAENKLRDNEEKYRSLFELSPFGVLIHRKGSILFANPSAAKMVNAKSPEELINFPLINLVDKDYIPVVQKRIEEIKSKGGEVPLIEEILVKLDGTKFFAEVIAKDIMINYETAVMVMFNDISERKLAEKALKESEEKFRHLVWDMQVGVLIQGPQAEIILSNPKALELLGLTEDQLLGKTSFDPDWNVIHEDGSTFPGQTHPVPMAIATRKSVRNIVMGVFRPTTKDRVWLLVDAEPQLNNDGTVRQVVCSFIDITKRKRAEEALRANEAKHSKMVANIGDVIVIIDKDGINRYKSPNIEKWFGWKPEEVVGKSAWDNIHPEDLDFAQNFIGDLMKVPNSNGTTECRYKCKDGSYKWIKFTGVNLLHDSEINGLLGNYHDITNRRESEELIRTSKILLEQTFEQSPVPMVLVSMPDAKLRIVNPACIHFLGVEDEPSLINTSLMDLKPSFKDFNLDGTLGKTEDLPLAQSLIGIRTDGVERYILRKDGTIRYELVSGVPIFDESGNVIAGYLIMVDITERKNAEILLQQQKQEIEAQYEEYMQLNEVLMQTNFDLEIAKKKAEESDSLKTAFLQNISHEIRTPLNGIIGFSNLLQDENISKEEIKEFTGIIQQGGKRLIEIVNNVLDISRIQTGQLKIDKKHISLNSLFSNLFGFFTPIAKAKNITLNFQTNSKNNDIQLYSDEAKLHQIFVNLINNAIKFTQSGSIDFGYEIISKPSKGSDTIQFYVKDTGIGISSDMHQRIFERFIQVEQSVSRGYEGAGLGLAISKGLVELLGGTIWMKSELNQGSIFYFTIPYTIFDYGLTTNTISSDIKQKTDKIKILIAEDDLTSFKYLKRVLKSDSFTILLAENGEQAVEIVRNTPDIGLILMDIRMPVMDGFEAARLIRLSNPEIPIIAQTAYAFTEERSRILSKDFDDYISKPIDKDLLFQIIEKSTKK